MVSRSHPSKPRSHDRGPESQEDTQTDFAALNVLGNIPTPTTAVDACLDTGFHLDNGVKITGGDGVLLVAGEAFTWRPWLGKKKDGQKNDLVNAKGQFEVDEQAWALLDLVWPRPGMFLLTRLSFILLALVECILTIWGGGRSTNSRDGRIDSASLAGDEEAYQLAGDPG